MPSILFAALLAVLALASDASPSPAPRKAIEASTDVTFVEIPVHVATKDGRPFRGLTKTDFELYDDGKPVTGWDLDVIDLEDFARKVLTPDVQLPPAAQRHFFFLFDLTFAQPLNVVRARKAAIDFALNSMKNGDLGAVATIDAQRGLKLVLSFTADRDQLAAGLATLALPTTISALADPLNLTLIDPSIGSSGATGDLTSASGRLTAMDAEMADQLAAFAKLEEKSFDFYAQGRIQAMAKEMETLARTLGSIRGRKTIVYFSEGFDSKLLSGITGEMSGRTEGDHIVFGEHWMVDHESKYGNSELRMALDEMFRVFKRSDCAIYSVDISGLAAQASATAEGSTSADRSASARLGSRGRGHDSLYALAAETGGQLFYNSNDLGEHLEKLQEQTALVYLLSYSPAQLKEPGKYHDLKVKVKRSGAQVSTRAGYYEPRSWSKLTAMERRVLAAEQIAYGLPRSDIPARALATAFLSAGRESARVPFILEVPGEPLVKLAAGETLTLEIYAYATDQSLKVKGYVAQSVSLDLRRVKTQLEKSGLKFYGEMQLPPGTHWLRVLLRIAETGRSGLILLPVVVPARESRHLFAQGPVFHEAPGRWMMVKAPPKGGAATVSYPFLSGAEAFIPAAEAVVSPASEETFSLYVYDGGPDDLEIRGEIRGNMGERLGPADVVKVASSKADAEGMVELRCRFRPGRLERGSYGLWIGLKGKAAGAEGETLGFFDVR
jgi:VWFA-related protein